MQSLSMRELERYDRQIRIMDLGVDGQLKLKDSRVLVVGVGGLGGVAAMYLAATGVGFIRIVDSGVLELNNLNRQIPYSEKDIGRLKVEAAAERLTSLNSDIVIEPIPQMITSENIDALLKDVDLVVDGLDNFEARLLVNDKCVELGIPFIHGAVYSFEGRLMTIIPGKTPCLRCLVPSPPLSHDIIPVIGPVPGVIGCLEALVAVKIITEMGKPFTDKILVFDGLSLEFTSIPISRSPNCPICSKYYLRQLE
ncbi:MAG: HesA/MoeB/ThiF family protein [Nitrososphaerota archaeon]